MLNIEKEKQESFFGDYIYEQVIPPDHFLVKLSSVVDFSFVNEELKDSYSEDRGRPAFEPQILFKLLILEMLYDFSDVEISRITQTEMAFKWFVGLKITDKVPDDSTLVRFRQKMGEEKLGKIFRQLILLANEKGLFWKKGRAVIIDSTAIRANVDIGRLAQRYKKGPDDKTYVTENSPDPEAAFGRKSKDKRFYGYKGHLNLDAQSELITEVSVTPGNEHDKEKFKDNINNDPTITAGGGTAIIGDKAYSGEDQRKFLKDLGLIARMIPHQKNDRDYLKGEGKNISWKTFIKIRAGIERKFGELKNWHGLGQARYLGQVKMYIQLALTAIAANLKRMVKLLFEPPPWLARRVSLKVGNV